MAIRVTFGEPICRELGVREKEVSLKKEDSETSIALAELARRLGVKLEDSEGSLMILVNGKVTSYASDHELSLQDGDHVELLVPLAGG
jgi:molybdopterin converting factor small subunit